MNTKRKDGEEEATEEVTEEATEEATEETTEEAPAEEAPAEEAPAEETPEEKALLNKIKGVVSTTVDEKFKAQKKNVLLVSHSMNPVKKQALDLMTKNQKFRHALMDKNGQREYEDNVVIAHYIRAMYMNDRVLMKDLSEGTDSEGGYLVPAPLSNKIYEIITAIGVARREMTVLPMTADTLDLSTLATKPTVAIIAEGAQITASDLVFGRKTLTAVKIAGITAMSNELIEDANVDLISYQVQKFAEAMATYEDGAFFNTNTGAITGILEDTTTTVTMASGDTSFEDLSYDYLLDVVYSLGAKQRQGAKWCFSKDILSLVMQLAATTTVVPLWSKPVEGQPQTLLGYPIVENDEMPLIGDDAVSTEFLAFGNFKEYIIGDRKAMTSTVLKEATIGSTNLAEKDSSGVRVVERVAGLAPTPLVFSVLKTAAS